MVDAQSQAMGLIGLQESYLAYIDVFFVLAIISALAVPLAHILRNVDLKSGQGGCIESRDRRLSSLRLHQKRTDHSPTPAS